MTGYCWGPSTLTPYHTPGNGQIRDKQSTSRGGEAAEEKREGDVSTYSRLFPSGTSCPHCNNISISRINLNCVTSGNMADIWITSSSFRGTADDDIHRPNHTRHNIMQVVLISVRTCVGSSRSDVLE